MLGKGELQEGVESRECVFKVVKELYFNFILVLSPRVICFLDIADFVLSSSV